MTPARDPKQVFVFIQEEKFEAASEVGYVFGRRHLGRGIRDDYGITWDHFGSSGIIYLAASGIVWDHLDSFGIICDHLGSSEII